MRAALDGADAEICPKLIGNGCELDDAMRFASGGAPADPPPDDPGVVEPPRPETSCDTASVEWKCFRE